MTGFFVIKIREINKWNILEIGNTFFRNFLFAYDFSLSKLQVFIFPFIRYKHFNMFHSCVVVVVVLPLIRSVFTTHDNAFTPTTFYPLIPRMRSLPKHLLGDSLKTVTINSMGKLNCNCIWKTGCGFLSSYKSAHI